MDDTTPTPDVGTDTRPFDVSEVADALARAGLAWADRLDV